jgi:uncharacterized membrane protein YhhN
MTLTVILSLLTLLSGALTITARFRESKWLEYIFKPLTMFWIILIVALNRDPLSTRYQVIILLGLLASLLGDIFLMLPDPK